MTRGLSPMGLRIRQAVAEAYGLSGDPWPRRDLTPIEEWREVAIWLAAQLSREPRLDCARIGGLFYGHAVRVACARVEQRRWSDGAFASRLRQLVLAVLANERAALLHETPDASTLAHRLREAADAERAAGLLAPGEVLGLAGRVVELEATVAAFASLVVMSEHLARTDDRAIAAEAAALRDQLSRDVRRLNLNPQLETV